MDGESRKGIEGRGGRSRRSGDQAARRFRQGYQSSGKTDSRLPLSFATADAFRS